MDPLDSCKYLCFGFPCGGWQWNQCWLCHRQMHPTSMSRLDSCEYHSYPCGDWQSDSHRLCHREIDVVLMDRLYSHEYLCFGLPCRDWQSDSHRLFHRQMNVWRLDQLHSGAYHCLPAPCWAEPSDSRPLRVHRQRSASSVGQPIRLQLPHRGHTRDSRRSQHRPHSRSTPPRAAPPRVASPC